MHELLCRGNIRSYLLLFRIFVWHRRLFNLSTAGNTGKIGLHTYGMNVRTLYYKSAIFATCKPQAKDAKYQQKPLLWLA